MENHQATTNLLSRTWTPINPPERQSRPSVNDGTSRLQTGPELPASGNLPSSPMPADASARLRHHHSPLRLTVTRRHSARLSASSPPEPASIPAEALRSSYARDGRPAALPPASRSLAEIPGSRTHEREDFLSAMGVVMGVDFMHKWKLLEGTEIYERIICRGIGPITSRWSWDDMNILLEMNRRRFSEADIGLILGRSRSAICNKLRMCERDMQHGNDSFQQLA